MWGVVWIKVALDSFQWLVFADLVPWKMGNFLTNWVTVSFSRRAVLLGTIAAGTFRRLWLIRRKVVQIWKKWHSDFCIHTRSILRKCTLQDLCYFKVSSHKAFHSKALITLRPTPSCLLPRLLIQLPHCTWDRTPSPAGGRITHREDGEGSGMIVWAAS